ncbi:MAG: NAD-dependent deacylase [bacterium]|nr:NAD-dependent deacylase [bacterium]
MNGDAPDLNQFKRIVFFTGAGLSAESGIPTYRGQGGTWQRYNYEDYACQRAFDRDPEKVWEFHEARRADAAGCEPNLAHRLIAEIAQAKPETEIVTQNIDHMHQRAGAERVIELHGSLWRVRCDRTGLIEENFDVPLKSRKTPYGDYWRPDLVWFEDPMNMETIDEAVRVIQRCDCLVSIGTSGLVYPAAQLPMLAIAGGAVAIEINPEETPISQSFAYTMRGPATEMMRLLWPEA